MIKWKIETITFRTEDGPDAYPYPDWEEETTIENNGKEETIRWLKEFLTEKYNKFPSYYGDKLMLSESKEKELHEGWLVWIWLCGDDDGDSMIAKATQIK